MQSSTWKSPFSWGPAEMWECPSTPNIWQDEREREKKRMRAPQKKSLVQNRWFLYQLKSLHSYQSHPKLPWVLSPQWKCWFGEVDGALSLFSSRPWWVGIWPGLLWLSSSLFPNDLHLEHSVWGFYFSRHWHFQCPSFPQLWHFPGVLFPGWLGRGCWTCKPIRDWVCLPFFCFSLLLPPPFFFLFSLSSLLLS